MQDKVSFAYIWRLNMWCQIRVGSAKPEHTQPDHPEPNQILQCQIFMFIQKREHSMTKVN